MHACDGAMKSLRSPSFTAPENCVIGTSTPRPARSASGDRDARKMAPKFLHTDSKSLSFVSKLRAYYV